MFSRFVAEHEIAHTYFPFYMGINETRYAFMDEGWATTFEYLIGIARRRPRARATSSSSSSASTAGSRDPSPLEDLPIITPADVLSGAAYGNNAYGKAALGYLALKDLLGDAAFRKCLHAFMDRWHGKHPDSVGFLQHVQRRVGQNLNWFWSNWFFSNSYIDLALRGVTKTGAGYSATIDNVGGMPAPVDLRVTYADGTTETVHQTPAIWQANQTQHDGEHPSEERREVSRDHERHLGRRGRDEQQMAEALITRGGATRRARLLHLHPQPCTLSFRAMISIASPSGSSIMNARVSPNACGASRTFTPSRRSFA